MSAFERRLRLGTGLFLVLYIVQHMLNHTLGLVSFEMMEGLRQVLTTVWRNPLVNGVLYFCLITHFLLALWSLFRKSTLKMPAWELAQLVLGLSVIPLLSGHATANWGTRILFDLDVNYYFTIGGIFGNPWYIVRQILLIIVVWLHVCVGLHFWLRLKRWYRKYLPVVYVVAVLIPILSLLGTVRVSFEITDGELDEVYGEVVYESYEKYEEAALLEPDVYSLGDWIGSLTPRKLNDTVLIFFYGLLAMTLLARWARYWLHQRQGMFAVYHPNGKKLSGLRGQTLLETIRHHGIPHASVCGGRARCTTCRVRIARGIESCPEPNTLEKQALTRIKAAPDVRLACQTRPVNDVHITPLVSADSGVQAVRRPGSVQGTERNVVAMFVDLRGSTQMGEKRLPYDVLFILNRFFSEMTDALHATQGHYAQFAGDGLMALYGLKHDLRQGCRQALAGAVRMQQRIDGLNDYFKEELDEPLRIGIGIHCGEAIVGTMGPPMSPNYSAIGDSINAAARLESTSKEFGCTLVVSTAVTEAAEYELMDVPRHSVTVRGKTKTLEVYAVDNDALTKLAQLFLDGST